MSYPRYIGIPLVRPINQLKQAAGGWRVGEFSVAMSPNTLSTPSLIFYLGSASPSYTDDARYTHRVPCTPPQRVPNVQAYPTHLPVADRAGRVNGVGDQGCGDISRCFMT